MDYKSFKIDWVEIEEKKSKRIENIHHSNGEKWRILGVRTMTWKMEENKILALEFEPLCAAFECTKTMETQKTIASLRVRMSTLTIRMQGLATMTVRTLIWAFEGQGKFKNFYWKTCLGILAITF